MSQKLNRSEPARRFNQRRQIPRTRHARRQSRFFPKRPQARPHRRAQHRPHEREQRRIPSTPRPLVRPTESGNRCRNSASSTASSPCRPPSWTAKSTPAPSRLHENWPSLDESGLLAVAFRDASKQSNAFDLLRRYETMLDRSIARNVKLLHDLQDRRKAAAVPAEARPRPSLLRRLPNLPFQYKPCETNPPRAHLPAKSVQTPRQRHRRRPRSLCKSAGPSAGNGL